MIGLLFAVPLVGISEEPSPPLPSGDAVIRAGTVDSEIVITTTSRLAGAIHSLTWKGREFVDSTDHGRQIQSAANFDAGGPFLPETFNPTEAGSVDDGAGPTSSSVLLHLLAKDNVLQTTNRMAFWLSPNGQSAGHPARNTTVVSNHLLTKRVTIGYKNLPQVIQYDVTFGVPVGEKHTSAQFEVVTGYMPAEFQSFWCYHPETRELIPLSDGPGEQPFPVVLATADGSHAMGILARDPPPGGMVGPGYGRFHFQTEKVVKWNCVYRRRDPENGIPATDYLFRSFVIVGNLASVKASLIQLARK
ncbi:MAG: hypothetical protein JSS49_21060 [Planctomycetes bacterium]|nr:hypothetical protein [Planctomycetota bacterium]